MNSLTAVLIDWFIEYFHSLLLYPSAPLHLLDNFLVLWAGHRVRPEYHGCISATVKHCQINWFLQKSRSDRCPGWESLCVFNTPWTFSSLTAEKRLFVSVGITATEKSLYWFDPLSNSSSPFFTCLLLSSSDVSGSAVGGHGGSQGDRGGLGSVLRDLVKPGDENLREMNKKLQNMLEEQLTKNMHLQKVIWRGREPLEMKRWIKATDRWSIDE